LINYSYTVFGKTYQVDTDDNTYNILSLYKTPSSKLGAFLDRLNSFFFEFEFDVVFVALGAKHLERLVHAPKRFEYFNGVRDL
jgi:hypothetical protein